MKGTERELISDAESTVLSPVDLAGVCEGYAPEALSTPGKSQVGNLPPPLRSQDSLPLNTVLHNCENHFRATARVTHTRRGTLPPASGHPAVVRGISTLLLVLFLILPELFAFQSSILFNIFSTQAYLALLYQNISMAKTAQTCRLDIAFCCFQISFIRAVVG